MLAEALSTGDSATAAIVCLECQRWLAGAGRKTPGGRRRRDRFGTDAPRLFLSEGGRHHVTSHSLQLGCQRGPGTGGR